MQLHHADDESLVAQCVARSSDKRALNELIRRYGRLVMQAITWTFQKYSATDREETEDVFQEVFVSLFEHDSRKLKAYVPGRAGLGTYLMTIARTSAINALNNRKKGRVDISDNLIDEEDGFLPVEDAEMMDKIRGMLVGFTMQERLFYHLYFEECMPPETVANVMGVTVDSVYSKKAKIIEKIRNGMRHVIKQA
jgi:RNA polymerase sigma-70 factor (ECF subfamily)